MSHIEFKDGSTITKSSVSALISEEVDLVFNQMRSRMAKEMLKETDDIWKALPATSHQFPDRRSFELMIKKSVIEAVIFAFTKIQIRRK